MKTVPSYPKILTLGSAYTQAALDGAVSIQEKVDGSQFGWGINEDGELVFRSKGVARLDAPDGNFAPAVEHLRAEYARWRDSERIRDCYFYGEAIAKPKHNVLKYGRVPAGNVVLFDGLHQGRWLTRVELRDAADILYVDLVPELYSGVADRDAIDAFLKYQSFLGDQTVEGVVIKNYGQTVNLGGTVTPLFTKLVRPEFKEAHRKEWGDHQPGRSAIEELAEAFCTPIRWEKAVQHGRDQGVIKGEPQDIPVLMRLVNQDIEEECAQDIKDALWKLYRKDILKQAVRRLPEWYKARLGAA